MSNYSPKDFSPLPSDVLSEETTPVLLQNPSLLNSNTVESDIVSEASLLAMQPNLIATARSTDQETSVNSPQSVVLGKRLRENQSARSIPIEEQNSQHTTTILMTQNQPSLQVSEKKKKKKKKVIIVL